MAFLYYLLLQITKVAKKILRFVSLRFFEEFQFLIVHHHQQISNPIYNDLLERRLKESRFVLSADVFSLLFYIISNKKKSKKILRRFKEFQFLIVPFILKSSAHFARIFSTSPLTKVTKIPRFIYPKISKEFQSSNRPNNNFQSHNFYHLLPPKNRFVLERFGPLRSKKVSTGRRAHGYALTHSHASFATFLFPLHRVFLCLPVCGSLINFSRSSPPRPEWLGERRERHHAFSQDLFGP